MAKRYMLVDSPQLGTNKQYKSSSTVNWKLCVLCQIDTEESLQCPANSDREPKGVGYKTLAEDLYQFKLLGSTPPPIDFDMLDDGSGIESTLMSHKSAWHKSCRAKFNKTKLQRAAKKHTIKPECSTSGIHGHASERKRPLHEVLTCFFCDHPAGDAGLHEAATYAIDFHVRQCALDLEDTNLLAKLSSGDTIAIEAKYHRTCLVSLYNRHRCHSAANQKEKQTLDSNLRGIAFAELVAYIEDVHVEGVAPVFKLADLANLYQTRMDQLGVTTASSRLHSTRLKERLLAALPHLSAHTEGRDVLLTFEDDVGAALKQACRHESDANHLAKAAQIVRQDMFKQSFSFNGSIEKGTQQAVIPPSLLALVNMVMNGPNIKHQSDLSTEATTAARSISQLVMFNSVKHARANVCVETGLRHNRERETPLTIYVAMKIHAMTRSRNLVSSLYHLGLCVSYDRLLQITADMANGICKRFDADQIVCPAQMRHGVFTTCAVDNIDHNPSSATLISWHSYISNTTPIS